MSMTVCLHRAKRAAMEVSGQHSWVDFHDDEGQRVTIFCPPEVAQVVAETFNLAMQVHRGRKAMGQSGGQSIQIEVKA